MNRKDQIDVDWAKIRAEYVNGRLSLNKIAEKYNLRVDTVKKRSGAEKWGDERTKRRKAKADAVAETLQEKDIKQTVKDIDRCCKAAGKLIDKINKGINQVDKSCYISFEDKTVSVKSQKNDDSDGSTVNTKMQRKIRTKQYNSLVDTKKIAELSKSLLNVKQILTGAEQQRDDEICGIIEIPAMGEIKPPDDDEMKENEQ